MRSLLLLPLLLLSCSPGQGGDAGDNSIVSLEKAQAPRTRAASSGPLATEIGLYEGGSSQLPNQMCVVERNGEQRFGLIVWGTGDHNCGGSGTLTRDGNKLRLAMTGDSQCTIEATVSGKTIKLPGSVPEGCAYYCGARASLGGAELTQSGAGEKAAMRARDLVGDPLCGGEG